MTMKVYWTFALLAVSMPAAAQYVATPRPSESRAAPASGDELHVTPKNGQTQEQQWADRYECHRWAKGQTGFDPTQQSAGSASGEGAARRESYRRAMIACLEGRGYTASYSTPQQPTPPPPPAVSTRARHLAADSEVKYRPLAVQIHGGYTITAGTTNQYLEDGPNVGFGLTWYPAPALPVGLRVDGSYSRFEAKDALLNGSDFTSGHEDVYGGDADLQLDLAHRSSRAKMYLFGGAGWYRERIHLRQVSLEYGTACDPYYCAVGYFPVLTALQRSTSPWHSSWNAGLGWEVATDTGASFFVEARYQRISEYNNKAQFVPIRVGLRF